MVRTLRIKGTDTYVKFLGASNEGISCQYLNGEHKGCYDIIAGDCLVEENQDDQLFRSTLKTANDMTNSYYNINIDTLKEINKLMAETIKEVKKNN